MCPTSSENGRRASFPVRVSIVLLLILMLPGGLLHHHEHANESDACVSCHSGGEIPALDMPLVLTVVRGTVVDRLKPPACVQHCHLPGAESDSTRDRKSTR